MPDSDSAIVTPILLAERLRLTMSKARRLVLFISLLAALSRLLVSVPSLSVEELQEVPREIKNDYAPQCTQAQRKRILEQLPAFACLARSVMRVHRKCRIVRATRCPQSNIWLEHVYQHDWRNTMAPFVGINVGCNKAFDAINLLRMGTRDPSFLPQTWKSALGNTSSEMRNQGEHPAPIPKSSPNRPGVVHCVEPLPVTMVRLQEAAQKSGYADKGLVLHHVAMSDRQGSVHFPVRQKLTSSEGTPSVAAVETGKEDARLDSCSSLESEEELNKFCTPVPMSTLDQHFGDLLKERSTIQVLKVDAEGWDYPVLFGGGMEMLKKVEYLEFENHRVGAWQNHSLQDAVEKLDRLGFTCYWAGKGRLWRISGCWMDHFGVKSWSNVACAHRVLAPTLAARMEHVFALTLGL